MHKGAKNQGLTLRLESNGICLTTNFDGEGMNTRQNHVPLQEQFSTCNWETKITVGCLAKRSGIKKLVQVVVKLTQIIKSSYRLTSFSI